MLTDQLPESTNTIWLGNMNTTPQKIRITLSCAKMISSATLRNSNYFVFANTKDFEIKVREPNSNVWKAFASGTLPNPTGQNPPPLSTFSGTPVTVEEVEFSCLNVYPSGSSQYCALNYIEFQ